MLTHRCFSNDTPAVVAEAVEAAEALLSAGAQRETCQETCQRHTSRADPDTRVGRLSAEDLSAEAVDALKGSAERAGEKVESCSALLLTFLVSLTARHVKLPSAEVDKHPLVIAFRTAPRAACCQAAVSCISSVLSCDDDTGRATTALAPSLKYALLLQQEHAVVGSGVSFSALLRAALTRAAVATSGDAASFARRCTLAALLVDTLALTHRKYSIDAAAAAACDAADAADVVQVLHDEAFSINATSHASAVSLPRHLGHACMNLMFDAAASGAPLAPVAGALSRALACEKDPQTALAPHVAGLAGLLAQATSTHDVSCLVHLLTVAGVGQSSDGPTFALISLSLLPALSLPPGQHSRALAALLRATERGAMNATVKASDDHQEPGYSFGALFNALLTSLRVCWCDNTACITWLTAMREAASVKQSGDKAAQRPWFSAHGPAAAFGGPVGLAAAACLWHPSDEVVQAAAKLLGSIVLARTALHSAPALVPALLRRTAAASRQRASPVVLQSLLAITHAASHASGAAAALRALACLTLEVDSAMPNTPAMAPLALRTLSAVAARHSPSTPRLVAAVSDACTSASARGICGPALKLAAAIAVRDACIADPSGRGLDLLMPLNTMLDARWPDAAAMALDALGELCAADVIDFYTALRVLQPMGVQQRLPGVAPPHTDAGLAAAWARFASHGSTDAAARPALAGPLLTHLWGLVALQPDGGVPATFSNVRVAAWSSLACYDAQNWLSFAGASPNSVAAAALGEVDIDVAAAAERVVTALVAAEAVDMPRGIRGASKSSSVQSQDDGPMYRLQTAVPKLLRRGMHLGSSERGAGPGATLLCWLPDQKVSRASTTNSAVAIADEYARVASEVTAFLRPRGGNGHIRLAYASDAMLSWSVFLRRWCIAAAGRAAPGRAAAQQAGDEQDAAIETGGRSVLLHLVSLLESSNDAAVADNAALALGLLPTSVPESTAGAIAALAADACTALQRVLTGCTSAEDPTSVEGPHSAAPLSQAVSAAIGLGCAAACVPASEAEIAEGSVRLLRSRLQHGCRAAHTASRGQWSPEISATPDGSGHNAAVVAASAAHGLGLFVGGTELTLNRDAAGATCSSTAATLVGAALDSLFAALVQCMPATQSAVKQVASSLASSGLPVALIHDSSASLVSKNDAAVAALIAGGACAAIACACDAIGRFGCGQSLPSLLQVFTSSTLLDDRAIGGAAAATVPALLTACLRWANLKEADALAAIDALLQRCSSPSTSTVSTIGVSDTRPGAACIAAGAAIHAALAAGVHVPTPRVRDFLQAATSYSAAHASPVLRASAAAGCANLLGASVRVFGSNACVSGSAATTVCSDETLSVPMLVAGPSSASLARAALKQMEALAADDAEVHVREAASWALALTSAAADRIYSAQQNGGAAATGGALDALPLDCATRVVCNHVLTGPVHGAANAESLSMALRILAASSRLPTGPAWGATMSRLLREHASQSPAVCAAVCTCAVAHARRVPSLAAFLDDILSPPRLRDSTPSARVGMFSGTALVNALTAVSEAKAVIALREATSLAISAGTFTRESDALWTGLRAILAGPSGRVRDIASSETVRFLASSCRAQPMLPDAVIATLCTCPRGEARAMLHDCAARGADAQLAAALACVRLVACSHLALEDLMPLMPRLMHPETLQPSVRALLLHDVGRLLRHIPQTSLRQMWMQSSFEAASSRGDLLPLAALACEWNAPASGLCMQRMPWPAGDADCAAVIALPLTLPAVCSALDLSSAAAETMHRVMISCGQGAAAQTARSCIATLKTSDIAKDDLARLLCASTLLV